MGRHLTSIIILSHNRLAYTRLCLRSIREQTRLGDYEIIAIDNGSQDGSAQWLKGKEQEDLRVILNAENQGFPKGCNQGLAIARGDELLLLNNDTVVTEHWLEYLREGLYSAPDVGAVGCVTNYCSNGQAVEVDYRSADELQDFARRYHATHAGKWQERSALVGFCLLFRREVYEQIGGLDERFSPGNFEDNDFCVRVWLGGYRCLLLKDTFIHHFGSVSFIKSGDEAEDKRKYDAFMAILERNEAYFCQKWHLPPDYMGIEPRYLFRDGPWGKRVRSEGA